MRFIKELDYSMQIKTEIIKLLTSNNEDWYLAPNLIRAEQTAIRQITNWIGQRYDCSAIFDGNNTNRDEYIITITIDVALYHLYSQTGNKDIPEHRQQRYQDVLDWIKAVSSGSILADLPTVEDDGTGTASDFMFQSRTPQNHKY